MTKQIELTNGYVALVDDEDFERLNSFNWCMAKRSTGVYAVTNLNGKTVLMHRLILACDSSLQIDHIDRDGLNNQKTNLRVATQSQNRANAVWFNPTGFKGVIKHGRKWLSRIEKSDTKYRIGAFDNPEDAARAYDAKARELFGEFAYLNFPIEAQQ